MLVGLERILNLDVQVASIPLVGPAEQRAVQLFARLDRQVVVEVKDGLLPMRVLCVGAGGKLDGLVAGAKLNVEPGNDGVDVVGAADGQRVGQVEGEVGDGDGVEVEGDERGGVGDDGLEFDRVDKGFGEGGALERRVVEAPDVIPDCEGVG